MINDTFGQGYTALDYADPPDLKLMGEGLLKTVGQTVMRFASATARNAALSPPTAGMVAYLADSALLTMYDGTTWVTMAAGSQVWTTITPSTGWTQDGNTNGTFQYRLLNIAGEKSIQFRGALGKSSYPTTPSLNSIVNSSALPVAVRPTTLRTILIACSDTNSDRLALKVDIRPDGLLEVFGFGTTVKPPWISFNGTLCSL